MDAVFAITRWLRPRGLMVLLQAKPDSAEAPTWLREHRRADANLWRLQTDIERFETGPTTLMLRQRWNQRKDLWRRTRRRIWCRYWSGPLRMPLPWLVHHGRKAIPVPLWFMELAFRRFEQGLFLDERIRVEDRYLGRVVPPWARVP